MPASQFPSNCIVDGKISPTKEDWEKFIHSQESHTLDGIRKALDEARNRMKYAAIEYARLGAHEEAERAAEIRRSITALSMERW